MLFKVPLGDRHPICQECNKSHRGYYSIQAWKGGYCPECGPSGSGLLKSQRELMESLGVPVGVINKQSEPNNGNTFKGGRK